MQGMQMMFQNIQELIEKNQEATSKNFEDLKIEMSDLKGEMKQIKETLGEMRTTISKHEERLTNVEKTTERVETQLDNYERRCEQAIGKLEEEVVFLEMEKSAFFLRLQNVAEDRNSWRKLGEIIAEVVGKKKEEVSGEIDEAYRVYTNYARRHNLPREIHIRLTKKALRDDILHKARDQNVTHKGRQITFLKQIPRRVREQRHNYNFITSQLRKHNAPYRWLLPEGLLVTWQERKIKIESIQDAQDFCEKIFGPMGSDRDKEMAKETQRDQKEEWRNERGIQKMIHSLFLINSSGDIFLEKHWKSVVCQSVCDYFFEAQERAADVENVPPVIPTPHHFLISIYRDKIFFVSVIQTEVPPLFVIEFLHRVADTFQDYFGECSETAIKDNVVIVYELLEEMLDNGFPLATESNILKELIKPPTILRSVVNSITGSSNVGDTLPTGQLSNIPWRRAGVKYTNNEAYFDVIEEIDAIIDKSGSTVFAEIQGVIDACVKLSGMPDLSLSFMNPRLLDDVSFHPCIRFKRWESERVLSFIPPDGNFRLISYKVSSQNLVAIPVYVKHAITFKENSSSGRFDVTIGPKQNMGKTIEGVIMTVHMPKAVLNMSLAPTQGSYAFDPVTKVLTWDVGKIIPQKLPTLKGMVNLQSGAPKPEENPSLNIQFKIQQLAISGLKVNRLDMYGEKYKPFKGVKYITKAGKFQVRT